MTTYQRPFGRTGVWVNPLTLGTTNFGARADAGYVPVHLIQAQRRRGGTANRIPRPVWPPAEPTPAAGPVSVGSENSSH